MTRTNDTIKIGGTDHTVWVERIDTWRDVLNPVGRFEVLLNRKNELTGAELDTAFISPQASMEIDLSAALVMNGYLDTVKLSAKQQEGGHHQRQCLVAGRDQAVDLDNKLLVFELQWAGAHGDDIIKDLIDATLCNITFTSPHTAPFVTYYTAVDKPLSKCFNEVLELIGYDGLVNEASTAWSMFNRGTLSSGIALKALANDPTNNVLDFSWDLDSLDIWNHVVMRGRQIQDGWTELNANEWSGYAGNVVSNEYVLIVAGLSSIKCAKGSSGGICSLSFGLSGIPTSEWYQLRWDKLGAATMTAFVRQYSDITGTTRWMYIRLTDSLGNVISYHDAVQKLPNDTWVKISAPVGVDTSVWDTGGLPMDGAWIYLSGTGFNWRIMNIEFVISMPDDASSYFLLDDLFLPGRNMWTFSKDDGSIASYGERYAVISRPDIYCQKELKYVADNYVAQTKDVMGLFRVTALGSAGIIGGVCKWLPGYTATLQITDLGISGSYRIMSVHLTASKNEIMAGHDFIADVVLKS